MAWRIGRFGGAWLAGAAPCRKSQIRCPYHSRRFDLALRLHGATAEVETAAGADLPMFVKDEFDALRECCILAHGFLRLRCGDCGQDERVAFKCKRHGFRPSCGARCMAQTAAHLVDQVIPHMPVRQWVQIGVMTLP